ncbi:MAG: hypothetical protein EOP04_32310 [Proteobacteria bacterium]|nr:MAG: hypothetical protein EOP04_32310 [Pseudomonadota bacterium]
MRRDEGKDWDARSTFFHFFRRPAHWKFLPDPGSGPGFRFPYFKNIERAEQPAQLREAIGFLMKGAVYSTLTNSTTISVDKPVLNQSFTGLGVDPASGIIYGGYARDSTTKGIVRRFQPSGVRIDSVSVGYVPSGFYFK